MGGKGPAPKPSNIRQRRNKKATATTLQAPEDNTNTEYPELLSTYDDHQWHPLTLVWWRHIWESPMAPEYLQTDIDGLNRLAFLVDSYYKKPDVEAMREIRLQEARFGLSPVDRSRLQWEVQKGEEAERKRKTGQPRPLEEGGGSDPRAKLGVVK